MSKKHCQFQIVGINRLNGQRETLTPPLALTEALLTMAKNQDVWQSGQDRFYDRVYLVQIQEPHQTLLAI